MMGTWNRDPERIKTLVNFLYLYNETALILVSRSGREQADLSCSFNAVGISLIIGRIRSWVWLHRKLIVRPESFITATFKKLRWENRCWLTDALKTMCFTASLFKRKSSHMWCWVELSYFLFDFQICTLGPNLSLNF